MYGDMIYVEDGQRGRPVAQLPHDKMAGRNEAWLRDMLFDHPELLPITDIIVCSKALRIVMRRVLSLA